MAETFQVSVGEQGKIFVMHRDIATRHSSFFKAALSHDWKEAEEKKISLPDCEPEIFEGYLQWVYTGEVVYCSERYKQALELVKLWILGDFLGDQNFCDAVVGGLWAQQVPASPDAIKHLYNHTPHESHLRSHIFGIWACRASITLVSCLFAANREYPKDFIIDLFGFLSAYGRVVDNPKWSAAPGAASAAYSYSTIVSDNEE